VDRGDADGVLITGVYGSGKSSVAAEIAYMLEHGHQPFALLDHDYLSWGGTGGSDRAEEFGFLLQNLADVAGNYRRAGIGRRQRCRCGSHASGSRWLILNSAWQQISPAAAVMICGRQHHRSLQLRARAWRMW
jgi:hypothetical protein